MSGRGDKRVLCAALGAAAGISAILLSPLRDELTARERPPAAQPEAILHVLSPRTRGDNALPERSEAARAPATNVVAQHLHATQTPSPEPAEDDGQTDPAIDVDDSSVARMRDLPDVAHGAPDKVVPHPIDEPRMRMTAQRQLFSEVKSALRAANFARARALLEQHDENFTAAESWADQREGYQLMLDCQQDPSDETRARGQRFVDEQRGSTLRRSVRRACLR